MSWLKKFVRRAIVPAVRVAAPVATTIGTLTGNLPLAAIGALGQRVAPIGDKPPPLSIPPAVLPQLAQPVLSNLTPAVPAIVQPQQRSPTWGQAVPKWSDAYASDATAQQKTTAKTTRQRLQRQCVVNVTVQQQMEPGMSMFREILRRPAPRGLTDLLDPQGVVRRGVARVRAGKRGPGTAPPKGPAPRWTTATCRTDTECEEAARYERRRRRSARGRTRASRRTAGGTPAQRAWRQRFGEMSRAGQLPRRRRNPMVRS